MAEDVIGGLSRVRDMTHGEGILQVIFVCDAPSHGKQYYDQDLPDDLKDEIEEEALENQLLKLKKLGYADTHFHCIKIGSVTDLMFEKMKEAWGEGFTLGNLAKPEEFLFEVVNQTLTSIKTSTLALSELVKLYE